MQQRPRWAPASGAKSAALLPRCAHALWRFGLEVAAERIDVDAAAAHETRVDRQRPRRTAPKDIDEHALDAAFVERRVAPVGHQIAQQSGAVDAWPPITDHEVAAVGLAGDRAARTEQRRAQRFLDTRSAARERRRIRLVDISADVDGID